MAKLLASGKTKRLYATDDPNVVHVHYTNHTTAGDGLRNEIIENKGKVCNYIDSYIFQYLNKCDVPTHFIKRLSDTDQLNRYVKMIPLEVVVRNYSAGHFAKRYGTKYMWKPKHPICEFFHKSDPLHDPMVNDMDAIALGDATKSQLVQMRDKALQISKLMTKLFASMNIILVDSKVEFGTLKDGEVILADEYDPDSCRILDAKTKKSMDKDVFRKREGNMMVGYDDLLHRLEKKFN